MSRDFWIVLDGIGIGRGNRHCCWGILHGGILHHGSDASQPPATNPDPTDMEFRCLILQLFWFVESKMTRPANLQESMPSWSWTSTMGSVSHHSPAQSAKPLVTRLQLSQRKETCATLCIRAKIKRWDPRPCYLGSLGDIYFSSELVYASHPPVINQEVRFSEFFSRSKYLTGAAVLALKATFMLGEDGRPRGWAGFDLGTVPQNEGIYVWHFRRMMSTEYLMDSMSCSCANGAGYILMS